MDGHIDGYTSSSRQRILLAVVDAAKAVSRENGARHVAKNGRSKALHDIDNVLRSEVLLKNNILLSVFADDAHPISETKVSDWPGVRILAFNRAGRLSDLCQSVSWGLQAATVHSSLSDTPLALRCDRIGFELDCCSDTLLGQIALGITKQYNATKSVTHHEMVVRGLQAQPESCVALSAPTRTWMKGDKAPESPRDLCRILHQEVTQTSADEEFVVMTGFEADVISNLSPHQEQQRRQRHNALLCVKSNYLQLARLMCVRDMSTDTAEQLIKLCAPGEDLVVRAWAARTTHANPSLSSVKHQLAIEVKAQNEIMDAAYFEITGLPFS